MHKVLLIFILFGLKTFPSADVILRCGSKELYIFNISSSKPLKTDNTKIKAHVPIATPTNDTKEITCTKLFFFFVEKYRLAIKNEKFTVFIFLTISQFLQHTQLNHPKNILYSAQS